MMLTRQQVVAGAKSETVKATMLAGRTVRVDFPDGTWDEFDGASHALTAIKARAARGNKTITITTIEWDNVPRGWKPPKG